MNLDEGITLEINKIISKSILDPGMRDLLITCWEHSLDSVEPCKWAKLTFSCSEIYNGYKEKVLPGAIAMELFALAADIFDDIQDQDNPQAPWQKIPFPQAISLANCLLFATYQVLLTIANPQQSNKAIQIFNKVGLKAGQGQYIEIVEQTNTCRSINEYVKILAKKSGSFLECACKIGGLLGDAPQGAIDLMGEIGINIGIIAQISNDLRDITNLQNKNDFIHQKKTLPYLYLMDVLEKEKAKKFADLINIAKTNRGFFNQKDQETLLSIIRDEGAIHFCMVVQDMFQQEALRLLEQIQVKDEHKKNLEQIINNV